MTKTAKHIGSGTLTRVCPTQNSYRQDIGASIHINTVFTRVST